MVGRIAYSNTLWKPTWLDTLMGGNVGDRGPAHNVDPAHRAQPAQKLMLEVVDLSNWSEIQNGASRYIGEGIPQPSIRSGKVQAPMQGRPILGSSIRQNRYLHS